MVLLTQLREEKDFSGGSRGKESACDAGDSGSIPSREDLLEKEMAAHSSVFAWEIPWTEEPGGLQSTGLQRVRRDLATEQEQQQPRPVLHRPSTDSGYRGPCVALRRWEVYG